MGLDLYEVFLEVEEEFDIRIPEKKTQPVQSVGDFFDITIQFLREQYPERFAVDSQYSEKVWQRLKDLLVRELGVKPEQVEKSARFFYELGFD